MTILIIIFITGLAFLLANEIEDESVMNTWKKHKQFCNTEVSWRNKWKLNSKGNPISNTSKKWYYFTMNPKYKERFLYSSTMLVWLTDLEHLSQFFKKRFIEIGFLVISWEFAVAWSIGTMIGQLIKEKFIKSIS